MEGTSGITEVRCECREVDICLGFCVVMTVAAVVCDKWPNCFLENSRLCTDRKAETKNDWIEFLQRRPANYQELAYE